MLIKGEEKEHDVSLEAIVYNLTIQFGREPDEKEVYTFIFGSAIERQLVWNQKLQFN